VSDGAIDPQVLLQLGREVLAQQPFSVLLGAEVTQLKPGHVELQLVLRDDLKQQHGFAHGGVVSYLADNALTYAGATAMRVPVITSEFKINYLRPAVGERLIARGKAESVGRTQSVCRCEIYAADGGTEKLCAMAQGTVVKMGEAPPA
jgi:uncharacterized protein (TIGR00369 family)